jgi:hypothetical protein
MKATERKSFAFVEFKMADDGTFKALVAPFNDEDKQGDITLPGAFGKQNIIISAYGHGSWDGALPVGKGIIYDGEKGGVVEGEFFCDENKGCKPTKAGNETYRTVKNLGGLQEWSYALPEIDFEYTQQNGHTVRVLKHISVNEACPVLMGAGNGTETLAIKAHSGLKLIDHVKTVTANVEQVVERIKEVAAKREADDTLISPTTMQEVQAMKAQLLTLVEQLEPVEEKHDVVAIAQARLYRTLNNRRANV